VNKPFFFQPLYFIFWVLYFIVARGAFLIYHLSKTKALSSGEIWGTFLHGSQLDFSFAAYLSVLPFLAVLIGALWKPYNAALSIRYYTYGLLVLLTFMLIADLELYANWGFRLDATPLQYLNTPGEMAASASEAPLLQLALIMFFISVGFIMLYKWVFDLKRFETTRLRWLTAILAFLLLVSLIVPIRGGINGPAINQSIVYFSKNPYTNHASLNLPWNFMHALSKYSEQSKNSYIVMPQDQAKAVIDSLYNTMPDTAAQYVSATKPNVIFIILESYTAQFIESLGGEKGVTPNLNKLATEGLNFTNMYASGDRSQKGMVALLSGYPVQPNTSIIKTPKKTEKLPHLSQVFGQNGYRTSYYYGGELEFANIKSYLLNGAYDKLIDKYDFPSSSYNSTWGADDHVVFDRVIADLKQEKQPFFSTVYTLSSHEPYAIPIKNKFPGTDETAKFRNSVYYTDWALGRFIDEAKKQQWWKNTLVVLVADHGHPLPHNYPNHASGKFHIPFVMTGGALTKSGEIKTIGSQTDIAATLLYQLGLPHQEFKWSTNLLAPVTNPFAFYVFNDGFGFLTNQGIFIYDTISKQSIIRDSTVTDEQIRIGKAYLQYSFEDFIQK
jgi:phosphoglycerol transferase MdoB-like AlkP superfamily enzyme